MFCGAFSQIPEIEAALKYDLSDKTGGHGTQGNQVAVPKRLLRGNIHSKLFVFLMHSLFRRVHLSVSPLCGDTKEKTVSLFRPLLGPKRRNYSIQEGPITVQQRFADPFGTTSDKAFDDEGEMIIQGYRVN